MPFCFVISALNKNDDDVFTVGDDIPVCHLVSVLAAICLIVITL